MISSILSTNCCYKCYNYCYHQVYSASRDTRTCRLCSWTTLTDPGLGYVDHQVTNHSTAEGHVTTCSPLIG